MPLTTSRLAAKSCDDVARLAMALNLRHGSCRRPDGERSRCPVQASEDKGPAVGPADLPVDCHRPPRSSPLRRRPASDRAHDPRPHRRRDRASLRLPTAWQQHIGRLYRLEDVPRGQDRRPRGARCCHTRRLAPHPSLAAPRDRNLALFGVTGGLEVRRFVTPIGLRRIGRPPLSREAAYEKLTQLPGARVRLVTVNLRRLAQMLGCHRSTAGRMLRDLEKSNCLLRLRRKGRLGILIRLLSPPPPASPATEVIGTIRRILDQA